jgi:hypothetical protein
MAYFMIEIILISQRGSEIFELNQKNLRGAAAKNGGIVQIWGESFALPFANQAAKDSFAVAKSPHHQLTRRFVKPTK